MGNNSVPKFIFRLSRFPAYRGSVLGRFYCISMEETKAENVVHNEPVVTTNVATVCLHEAWATHMRRGIFRAKDGASQ